MPRVRECGLECGLRFGDPRIRIDELRPANEDRLRLVPMGGHQRIGRGIEHLG